jgi:hypothetical protein
MRYTRPAFHRPRCEHCIQQHEQPAEYDYRRRRHNAHPERYPLPLEQCIRKAKYRINGVNYCTQHAGKALLDALFPTPPEEEINDRTR